MYHIKERVKRKKIFATLASILSINRLLQTFDTCLFSSSSFHRVNAFLLLYEFYKREQMFGKQQRGRFALGKRGDEETQVEVRVRDGLIRFDAREKRR